MASRSFRNRLGESTNIWPGFVDVLATLLIVIIFVLMIFTVSQIYLSDAISGRDKALQELRIQISELSKPPDNKQAIGRSVVNTLFFTLEISLLRISLYISLLFVKIDKLLFTTFNCTSELLFSNLISGCPLCINVCILGERAWFLSNLILP